VSSKGSSRLNCNEDVVSETRSSGLGADRFVRELRERGGKMGNPHSVRAAAL